MACWITYRSTILHRNRLGIVPAGGGLGLEDAMSRECSALRVEKTQLRPQAGNDAKVSAREAIARGDG